MNNHIETTLNQPPLYGFLCQETNIFYAFETEAQYLDFLAWFESEAQNATTNENSEMVSES